MPTSPTMNEIAQAIAALPMDEPPTAATLSSTERCASWLADKRSVLEGDAPLLIASMIACLEAARARQVLYVFAVPHLVSAAELLASPAAKTTVALAGARFEIESLLPVPGRGPAAPDVPLSALSRETKRDRRG